MKSRTENKSGGLSEASREAVNKVLRGSNRRGSRGKKKQDDNVDQRDLAVIGDARLFEKGKQVEPRLTSNSLEERGCSSGGNAFAVGDDDEINDSDWEECSIPSLSTTVNTSVDDLGELKIEFDGVPDAKSQKNIYRATAEDKERAELVHKVHLLCLLARGRMVDKACDDPLIQASMLSLLPSYLLKVSSLSKITIKDIAPLLRWFRGVFSVRDESSSGKTFSSSLAFALESREGTSEELAALTVALFRALKLTTRFVSILDVASLKPGADKDKISGQNRNKMKLGLFSTSTLMVSKRQAVSSSPVKSENKNLRENSENVSAIRKDGCSTSNNAQSSGSIGTNPLCEVPPISNEFKDKIAESSSEAGTCSKSEGLRKKGDLEFEMQLAMALTATAAANKQHDLRLGEKSLSITSSETMEKIQNASVSDQVSTAIGSKKMGSPLYWAEVYCNGDNIDGRWVHFDAVNGIIDAEQSVEAAAAACKTSLRYVIAFAGGGAKDVTRRYCTKWHKIASKRVSPQWLALVLAPLRQLESAATGGSANMEKESLDSNDPVPATTSSSIGIRSALEDMELATRALTEPLPTNQQAYKNHELYAIEKWLTKNQILRPKGPILGFCSGHPVYPRTCVQTLRTKERWLREGLQVKANEVPAKILRRNSKHKKVDFEDGEKNGEGGSQCMELYGKWQLEPLRLPHAVNGIVPKNERGQVDVWSEKCLPPGTVHIRLPRIYLMAKRLGIDYAPAMVGFEYKSGHATPVFDGIVVCTEFKDAILEAFAEEQERREADEKRRNEVQAAARWYQLLSSILTRENLKRRYVDDNQSNSIQVTQVESKLETVMDSPVNQKVYKRRRRLQRELSKGDDSLRRSNRLIGESESHEHVFLEEEETFDEGSLVRTKRCRCGFSVQVEQM